MTVAMRFHENCKSVMNSENEVGNVLPFPYEKEGNPLYMMLERISAPPRYLTVVSPALALCNRRCTKAFVPKKSSVSLGNFASSVVVKILFIDRPSVGKANVVLGR
jgi:hypothetical protein